MVPLIDVQAKESFCQCVQHVCFICKLHTDLLTEDTFTLLLLHMVHWQNIFDVIWGKSGLWRIEQCFPRSANSIFYIHRLFYKKCRKRRERFL